jgi:chromosome segregation ATPase
MLKKVLILGVVVLAGLFVAKKTHLCSYASTLWTQVRQEARAQVPTSFELDRIRNEIGRMEGDIANMVSPIAEHMADISKLRKDITKTRSVLTERKAGLQTMLSDLQNLPKGEEFIAYGDRKLTPDRVRDKVQTDFGACKRLETTLASQERLLATKERALEATREQLNKLIAQKREFALQLAELEARQQELDVRKSGSDLRVDDSRATEIKDAIERIEHRQEVETHKLDLINGDLSTTNLNPRNRGNTGANLDEVRAYLQGPVANNNTTTASRK